MTNEALPDPGADGTSPRRPRRIEPVGGPIVWLGIGALIAVLTGLWSLAIPLMASPDEPSHVVKAAAVARGQWSGELGPVPSDRSRPGAATTVVLPSDYAAAVALPNCIAFRPEASADCQPDIAPAAGTAQVETFAGQYPPLYYVLVGWPSLWFGVEASVYAMRLVGAILAAALLTWGAYRSVADGSMLSVWGVMVAVTPMTLFLAGTVNPQSLEIAAGFSFLAACFALATSSRGPSTAAMVQAAVSGALLVNVRTSSPLWAVAIVLVALVAARPGRWRELVAHPAAPWVGLVAVMSGAAAVGWLVTHGAVVTGGGLYPEFANPLQTTLAVLGHWSDYLVTMVGDFGWLDTPAPPATLLAWSVAGGALLLLALNVPRQRRLTLGLLALLATVAAAPVVLQLPTAADVGLIWQGRYSLPVAVGIPVLAALLLAAERPLATWYRALRLVVPVILIGHVAAFASAAHRYSEGVGGEFVTLNPDWSSPIGYLTGVAAYATVSGALFAVAWRAVASATRTVAEQEATGVLAPQPHLTGGTER